MGSQLMQLLGVRAPILLGPFGGLSSIRLTGEVSELGGLGSYGLYGYSRSRIVDTVAELRAATSRPFALNLWLPYNDERGSENGADFESALAALAPFFRQLGIDEPERPPSFLPSFDEQFRAVIDSAPAVVSFVYGVPSLDVVEQAHRAGIVVIGTATTVDEAVALERGGVDAVVGTGSEAAGHRVSFLLPAEESLVGTFALIPQIVDAIDIPVIAAGGIADRRGVAAAFALGASGVQVGTAFLRTEQSAASPSYRAAISQVTAHGTVLTRAMSGRLARGIPNQAVREIEMADHIASFPAQNWLTGRFRGEAARRDRAELQSLWAGQAASLARLAEARDVFAELAMGVPNDR